MQLNIPASVIDIYANRQPTISEHQDHIREYLGLRQLEPNHRLAVTVCFLCQLYRDTMDHTVDMYDKLINKIYNHAQKDVDDYHKSQRKQIRASLKTFDALTDLILDASIDDYTPRLVMFDEIGKDQLLVQKEAVGAWLNGKHSNTFNLVKNRFSYIRQFSPYLLKHIRLLFDGKNSASLEKAVVIMREMNNGVIPQAGGDFGRI